MITHSQSELVSGQMKKDEHFDFRDRVFVTGVIRYDEYTDNQDNQVRTTTILASELCVKIYHVHFVLNQTL